MTRIVDLSTRITAISRRNGRSATAAAAYRACCAVYCEREDRVHDYTKKRGLEVSRIIAPDDAPAWAMDRSALWNAAELRERNGKRGPNAGQFKATAKTAREFLFAFPAELSAAGRLAAAETIARHLVQTHGLVADFSIHLAGKDGDERNVHCHMLTTTRRMTADGLGEKAREWDAFSSGKTLSKQFRAFVAATLNEALAEEGKANAVHVEHRSFKARGSGQRPQKHLGPTKTNALRRSLRQSRQAWQSAHRHGQTERHAKERAALAAHQQRALHEKRRDLADREQRAAHSVADEANKLAAAAPGKPGALRRLAALFSSQAAPTQVALPASAPDGQANAVKAKLTAEHTAYLDGQAKERQALDARHAAEDRQLDAAATHRLQQDRHVEQQHRRDPGLGHGHDFSRDPQRTIERDSAPRLPR